MSTFEVKIVRIDSIEPISGADNIELAKIADYRSIIKKGQFKAGDLAVYIPESSVVPDWLLERMGLTGKLAGKKHNQVKAIKLRGCLSQGLLYKVEKYDCGSTDGYDSDEDGNNIGGLIRYHHPLIAPDNIIIEEGSFLYADVKLGKDVADLLGIIKYTTGTESALVPEWLLEDIGLKGKLSGKD